MGLPRDMRDTAIPKFLMTIQSPQCRKALALAHSLSCVGVFVSIISLCIAVFSMGREGISTAEFCLAAIALSFSVPHAILAWDGMQGLRSKASPENEFLLAMASEASTMGPQFAVILACADVAGTELNFWQRLLTALASLAFLVSLAACGRWPSRRPGSVVAPVAMDLIGSIVLDVVATVLVVQAFPNLRGAMFWVYALLIVVLSAVICIEVTRSLILEFAEPIMPLLSSQHGRLPASVQRDGMRMVSRILLLLCSGMILTEVWRKSASKTESAQQYSNYDAGHYDGSYNYDDYDYRQHESEYDPGASSEMTDDYSSHHNHWDHYDETWSDTWEPALVLRWRLTTTTTTAPPSDKDLCLKGYTYPTGNMVNDNAGGYSAHACLDLCQQDARCLYWDWGEGICRLRDGPGAGGAEPHKDYTGGPRGCYLPPEDFTSDTPEVNHLLSVAGEAMGMASDELYFKDIFADSRILLFGTHAYHYDQHDGHDRSPGTEDGDSGGDPADASSDSSQQEADVYRLAKKWQTAVVEAAEGSNLSVTAEVGPQAFPAYLNATLCLLADRYRANLTAGDHENPEAADIPVPDAPDDTREALGPDPLEGQQGLNSQQDRDHYMDACQAWKRLHQYRHYYD
eukprot:gb/GFBE01083075.1/.p1 GENE.gb/GFBE01083075.1/~~gb/GFBE01083075.1/.p1  ORF type:complete len:628 (+),score=100.09 gb/GFBE01083075.1/:1-1884(+)